MPSRTSMGQPTANASAELNSEIGDEDDLLALLKETKNEIKTRLSFRSMFKNTIDYRTTQLVDVLMLGQLRSANQPSTKVKILLTTGVGIVAEGT